MEKIIPNWPAPKNITAFTTTVNGGISEGNFASNNVGMHVEDNPNHVIHNRQQLQNELGTNKTIMWLNQVHGEQITFDNNYQENIDADASISRVSNAVCAIMTADCLPILICNQAGNQVAALHCGWKGLYQQLISQTLAHFDDDVVVWLGPAISQAHYEIDTAFYQRFIQLDKTYSAAFIATRPNHYLCDLYELAKIELHKNNITAIFGGEYCTFSDSRFYSYRQNPITGRQVSIITFD